MTDTEGKIITKEQAQRRVDRVLAFQDELAQLEEEKILVLPPEEKERVLRHHRDLLSRLKHRFDVDTTAAARQMSLGMKIVSFLGALALSAAIFFFFYRFWGIFGTAVQVTILLLAPVLTLVGVEVAARIEKTFYFASLIALVSISAFVLDLVMLGQIFSITPSQNAFLVWGLYALLLAYTYRLKLPLVAGIVSILGYLAATVGTWSGLYWLSFGERPENFIIAGAIIFAVSLIPHRRQYDFPPVYRVSGALTILTSILILSHWGEGSYLMIEPKTLEYSYQVTGFVAAAVAIWLGIKRQWPGITNTGSVFFVIFLYTKFFDWWWDWMPKYLFFLILGLIAIGLLLGLKKLRLALKEVAA